MGTSRIRTTVWMLRKIAGELGLAIICLYHWKLVDTGNYNIYSNTIYQILVCIIYVIEAVGDCSVILYEKLVTKRNPVWEYGNLAADPVPVMRWTLLTCILVCWWVSDWCWFEESIYEDQESVCRLHFMEKMPLSKIKIWDRYVLCLSNYHMSFSFVVIFLNLFACFF